MTDPNNEQDPNTGSTADKSNIPSDSERARAGAELKALWRKSILDCPTLTRKKQSET